VEAPGQLPSLPPPLKSGLAMLARYMLSSCVCPSVSLTVRPSQAGTISKLIQIGLCMLMPLSIHLHGLHLDAQYGET